MIKNTGIKTILFFLMILLIAGCTKKGPVIQFHKLVYNFGSADEGKKVQYTFTFSNTGNETLIIEEVNPSCKCTVASEFDKKVEPGKRGGIPIALDTRGFQGHVSKPIQVKTNVPDQEPYTLIIEGTVKVQVAVNPRTLVLGKINEETKEISGVVTITNNTTKPMKITEIIPQNDKTELSLSVTKQDKEFSLDITVKPPYKKGQTIEEIIMKTTLPDFPDIVVKYSYFLPSDLEVKPTEIHINPNTITEKTVREIYIYTGLDIELEIADVNITSKSVEYIIEEMNPKEIYKIVLHFKQGFRFPPDTPVYVTFRVDNAPGSPVFTVPIKDSSTM